MRSNTARLAAILSLVAIIALSLTHFESWLAAEDQGAAVGSGPWSEVRQAGQARPAARHETGPALQGRLPRPTASPVGARWIRGRLLRPEGSPLAGARIAVAAALHGAPPTIRPGLDLPTSDADGFFDVELPADASIARVLVHRAGYGGAAIPRWPAGTQRTVVVAEGPSCKGIVRGAEGATVPGAAIRFQMAARAGVLEFMTQSNEQGAYRLDGLLLHASARERAHDRGADTLHLRAVAAGCAVQDEPLPHTTETGVVYLIDFKLDGGRIIRGRVLDRRTGTPIGRADILVRALEETHGLPAEGLSNPFNTTVFARGESDAMGRFRLTLVPASHYTKSIELVVRASGYRARELRRSISGPAGSITRVVARLRIESSAAERKSKRGRGYRRSITGRILLPDGRPARGSRVWWRTDPAPYRPGHDHPAYTDADGRYRLDARSRIGCVLAILPGHALAWRSVAEHVTEVRDVRIAPARSVSGTLVDGDGEPLVGYQVMALVGHPPKSCGAEPATTADAAAPSVCIEETWSRAEGRYRFDNIAPGPVHVVAQRLSYKDMYPRVIWQVGIANVRGSGPLTIRVAFLHPKPDLIPEPILNEQEPEPDTLKPEEPVLRHTLRLRLEAPLGITPEEVAVTLRDSDGEDHTPRSGAAGSGDILALHDLLLGRYEFRIRVPGFPRVVLKSPRHLTIGDDPATVLPLRLILGGTLQARVAIPIVVETFDDGDSVSLEAPEVVVEVRDASDARVWQRSVGGWMTAGPRQSMLLSDRPQHVTRALPPGRYTLRAIRGEHTVSAPFLIRAGEETSVRLKIR